MKILHLTLHKKWFDLIASGEKKEEYRDQKGYWRKRLFGRVYDEVHFKNGYRTDSPFMRVEWKGCSYRSSIDKYVIALGKVIEVRR